MSRIPRLWVVAIVSALLCACSNGSKTEAKAQAQPAKPAQSAPEARKKRNACAFVPRSVFEGIAKEELFLLHDIKEEDMTVCEVSYLKTKKPFVTVNVYWAGGKELARTNQAAMSMAKQMLNDKDTDIEELTGSGKVRGLADKAYYSNVMPSWFLKGDVLVEVLSPLLRDEQKKPVFMAIAKQALPLL